VYKSAIVLTNSGNQRLATLKKIVIKEATPNVTPNDGKNAIK